MSLYPGSARPDGHGGYVLHLQDSMAKAIEDAMEDVFRAVNGAPPSQVGREDRQLLYVAISRGILQYLKDHRDAITTAASDGGFHRHDVDLNVTIQSHLAHR